jgi:hypothetical protein
MQKVYVLDAKDIISIEKLQRRLTEYAVKLKRGSFEIGKT